MLFYVNKKVGDNMIKRTIWIFPLVGIMLVTVDVSEVSAEEIVKPKEVFLEEGTNGDQLLLDDEPIIMELAKSESNLEILQNTPGIKEPQKNLQNNIDLEDPQEKPQKLPQNDPELDNPQEEPQKLPQNDPELDNPQEEPQELPPKNPELDNPQEEPQELAPNNPELDNPQEEPQELPPNNPELDNPQEEPQELPQNNPELANPQEEPQELPQNNPELANPQEEPQELPQENTQETDKTESIILESIVVTPVVTNATVGDTIGRLEVVYNPGNAVKPKWEYWWSTNTTVATVDAGTGVITVLRPGTTMIMVEVDTGQEAGAMLTVSDDSSTPVEDPLKTISVTPPTTDAKVGETIGRLDVVYNPGNAVKPKWEYWWSTNTTVATVDAGTGVITVLRPGSTMIMVEVDTGQEAGAMLTVSDDSSTPADGPLESISIDSSRTDLKVGETIGRLDVIYNPGDAVKPKWEYWWSQNPDIAIVDSATGVITTIRNGKVTILVEVDTGQVASKKFIVGVLDEKGPNSQIFIPLPTEYDDGTDWPGRKNQATHPSVVQFESSWNGYKYWMGFTPYPYGDDQKENPSVVASHDGINWVIPENISNPLVPIEVENAYNSDTHLVYNSTTNELELWYRQVQNATYTETLFRIKTTDAINWTMPEAMISASSSNYMQLTSPSIVYENGKYKLWFNRDWEIHYAESLDGKNWSEVIKINTAGKNIHTWHPNIQKFDDTYYLLNNDNDTNAGIRGAIRYSTSTDGINFTEETFILTYSDDGESYDSAGVYRASMAMGEHGVYLYYGQISDSYQWTIGMSIGADLGSLIGLDEETLAGFTRV